MRYLNYKQFEERNEFFDPELDDPNDSQWKNFHESFEEASEEWKKDPTVKAAISTLAKKHKEILEKFFPDQESDEFSAFNEELYQSTKEDSPDERTLFNVFWFNDPNM